MHRCDMGLVLLRSEDEGLPLDVGRKNRIDWQAQDTRCQNRMRVWGLNPWRTRHEGLQPPRSRYRGLDIIGVGTSTKKESLEHLNSHFASAAKELVDKHPQPTKAYGIEYCT